MIIRVPFRRGFVFREKDIDFIFNIATLEQATEEILGCDLFEVEKQKPYDVNVAILLAGHYVAWLKNPYVFKIGRFSILKKRYNLNQAKFWIKHMKEESQESFMKAVEDMIGKMSKGAEKKK